MGKSALFVFAHPDDAEFFCGGTIAKLTGEGWSVMYAVMNDGEKGSFESGMDAEKLVQIRRKEQLDAAAELGVRDVHFLSLPDGFTSPTTEAVGTIVRLMRKHKPDRLYTFDPSGDLAVMHPDHYNAGLCAIRSAGFARLPLFFPEHKKENLHPHFIGEIYLFSSETPNEEVDISAYVQKKIKALKIYASQTDMLMDIKEKTEPEPAPAFLVEKFRKIPPEIFLR